MSALSQTNTALLMQMKFFL